MGLSLVACYSNRLFGVRNLEGLPDAGKTMNYYELVEIPMNTNVRSGALMFPSLASLKIAISSVAPTTT